MQVSAFYHLWAEGEWEAPFDEFLCALRETGFDAPLYVGVVGGDEEAVDRVVSGAGRDCAVFYSETGWEQVTLDLVRAYAERHDGAVLYAHDKGSWRPDSLTVGWRRAMTWDVVRRWRDNLTALEDHDVVGWAWLDERVYWNPGGFLGNFWMARCDYLRELPPCSRFNRSEAEVWVGCGNPRVLEREEWDREKGPPQLWPVWGLWMKRWRWMAEYPAAERAADGEVRQLDQLRAVNV